MRQNKLLHPLKICVITQQFGKIFSGPGLYANNLVNALVADGHIVSVISPINQQPNEPINYEFLGVRQPIFNDSQARWIPLSYLFWREFQKIPKNTFDLIHFTDAREALFFKTNTPCVGNVNDTYAAELRSISYYQKYYTDWPIRWPYYLSARFFERLTYNKLDALIANSKFTEKIIHQRYRINREKIYICYKSIDLSRYTLSRLERNREPRNFPVVLFVGTNMQRKGLPTLIRAAHIVMKKVPHLKFWIVGEDKTLPKMKELCIKEGVYDSFCFLGWKSQDELRNIYSRADVFVMPSLTEALGVVFLEAMASGLPIIGTNIGGIPEIIQDGINGLLVPPDDPKILAKALTQLLLDSELQQKLSINAQEIVKKFNVDHMIERTYQIYSRVINKKLYDESLSDSII